MSFDPNQTATADSGLFGLPYGPSESLLHVIPVPWEVTTSYGDGTSRGPAAVLRASRQVDLFDIETGRSYENGYYLTPHPTAIQEANDVYKAKAASVVEALENGEELSPALQRTIDEINAASEKTNQWVYEQAVEILDADRIPALIGGDHSTPFGLLQALGEKYEGEFGILHIDAHADLRDRYQGYEHSHASIMYNVMEKVKPAKLVQVGIRDFCEEEYEYIKSNPNVTTFFDTTTKRRQHRGETWQSICDDIVSRLPPKVYVSFDIDGLSPELCPHTGTPVPGGLNFPETLTLFATLAESGRQLIGFDLCEVGEMMDDDGTPNDWDGNVGARLLFKLCGWTMVSNGKRIA